MQMARGHLAAWICLMIPLSQIEGATSGSSDHLTLAEIVNNRLRSIKGNSRAPKPEVAVDRNSMLLFDEQNPYAAFIRALAISESIFHGDNRPRPVFGIPDFFYLDFVAREKAINAYCEATKIDYIHDSPEDDDENNPNSWEPKIGYRGRHKAICEYMYVLNILIDAVMTGAVYQTNQIIDTRREEYSKLEAEGHYVGESGKMFLLGKQLELQRITLYDPGAFKMLCSAFCESHPSSCHSRPKDFAAAGHSDQELDYLWILHRQMSPHRVDGKNMVDIINFREGFFGGTTLLLEIMDIPLNRIVANFRDVTKVCKKAFQKETKRVTKTKGKNKVEKELVFQEDIDQECWKKFEGENQSRCDSTLESCNSIINDLNSLLEPRNEDPSWSNSVEALFATMVITADKMTTKKSTSKKHSDGPENDTISSASASIKKIASQKKPIEKQRNVYSSKFWKSQPGKVMRFPAIKHIFDKHLHSNPDFGSAVLRYLLITHTFTRGGLMKSIKRYFRNFRDSGDFYSWKRVYDGISVSVTTLDHPTTASAGKTDDNHLSEDMRSFLEEDGGISRQSRMVTVVGPPEFTNYLSRSAFIYMNDEGGVPGKIDRVLSYMSKVGPSSNEAMRLVTELKGDIPELYPHLIIGRIWLQEATQLLTEPMWEVIKDHSRIWAPYNYKIFNMAHEKLTESDDRIAFVGEFVSHQNTLSHPDSKIVGLRKILRLGAYRTDHFVWRALIVHHSHWDNYFQGLNSMFLSKVHLYKSPEKFLSIFVQESEKLQEASLSPRAFPIGIPRSCNISAALPEFEDTYTLDKQHFQHLGLATAYSSLNKLFGPVGFMARNNTAHFIRMEKRFTEESVHKSNKNPTEANAFTLVLMSGGKRQHVGVMFLKHFTSSETRKAYKKTKYGSPLAFASTVVLAGNQMGNSGFRVIENTLSRYFWLWGSIMVEYNRKRKIDRIREIAGWIGLVTFFVGVISSVIVQVAEMVQSNSNFVNDIVGNASTEAIAGCCNPLCLCSPSEISSPIPVDKTSLVLTALKIVLKASFFGMVLPYIIPIGCTYHILVSRFSLLSQLEQQVGNMVKYAIYMLPGKVRNRWKLPKSRLTNMNLTNLSSSVDENITSVGSLDILSAIEDEESTV